MADKTLVVFALDYSTLDGKHHKGGAEVAVDSDEARDLVARGVVQYAKETDNPVPPAAAETPKGGK